MSYDIAYKASYCLVQKYIMSVQSIIKEVKEKYEYQPTFVQAVEEFLLSAQTYIEENLNAPEDYRRLRRLIEPERIISFRVDWIDDAGEMQTNTGYRVQYNSAIGPYKGGLRLDPSVNEDVLKFLGFEQIFKNALTGLPLGGGKGGSDFNPKGRSDAEIRSFSRAFMLELHRHIGIDRDVPAGDIGVGAREIGYLYGAYKQITNSNEGALTGKDELFGGSCQRTEATGHGVVYFAEAMAKHHGFDFKGHSAVISGSGNVAQYTATKLMDYGVTVLTVSDRGGYLHKPTGFTHGDIHKIHQAKIKHQSLSDIQIEEAEFNEGKPWGVTADLYFPCATQNEVDEVDAKEIVKNAKLLVEGSNMPLTDKAVNVVQESSVLYAQGKAANAGGVTVSGIEMAQNAGHYAWDCEKIDLELQRIMRHIHSQSVKYGKTDKGIDYVRGANIAGLVRVMDSMKKLGW